MKARVFNLMQYEKHPETGETLLTEDKIKIAVAHKTITSYAYVLHDKDVFSEEDEVADPKHEAGKEKPPHWHVVVETKSGAVEIGVIAKWFGIAENFVNVGRGTGAFLDCVQYLTHEDAKQQLAGKYRYKDDCIKANFDFRKALDLRQARRTRYGKDLNDKDALRNEVLYRGVTLRDASAQNPLGFQNDLDSLRKLRLYYLSCYARMPKTRMNYYVEGSGGVGKGLICRAIARALFWSDPDNKDKDPEKVYDDDIYFEVGSDKTTFEGYDGQPCIIWNDCRAYTLLMKLGGRENVFNVFDPHPPSIRQNIKYGSVRLTNKINIVNSVEKWKDFLDGLAGEYITANGEERHAEDKNQSYRRFPFFIVMHEEDYDIGMNMGLFNGTREFDQYMTYEGLRANMRSIARRCGENIALQRKLEIGTVQPVVEKHKDMLVAMNSEQQGTDEEIMAEFADYGKQREPGTVKIIDASGPGEAKVVKVLNEGKVVRLTEEDERRAALAVAPKLDGMEPWFIVTIHSDAMPCGKKWDKLKYTVGRVLSEYEGVTLYLYPSGRIQVNDPVEERRGEVVREVQSWEKDIYTEIAKNRAAFTPKADPARRAVAPEQGGLPIDRPPF